MKLTEENIIELLKKELTGHVDFKTFKNDIPMTDQGVDSLDKLTLFLGIEEHYGIKIEEEDIDRINTVNEILAFVNK
ncbi:acyl carrier protein [Carboxylicivirga sp. A043]|uniref:acyl carrier protein n=1 Tax=Carboxylicivirga litoralis TaxID=2816963 RepID=UPI0021CB8B64|nr:acyl carrier protein [Carboxylicivirga sp. A043]MCU4157536.1 acyl carrier protein [Carboxylicivirga sp. A043]